ncbi:MAG TPA: isoleucine--tRNA ligase [candidate division Zixibacteria bacterium]|nr:isoleucine--tRNA ligase [candidate division Zixibacteria bacterium]
MQERKVFKAVSGRLDMPVLEREQIEVWRQRRTMERYLARNAQATERWSFLDGPITANNPMGVHHAWGRTYKDLYQRYHTMLGHRQRYQNGFDCQGLWIEVEAEKELGFRNKRDIEAYGIDRFVEYCKARVQRFADRITEQSIRLGMWMDWENSYYTNSDENNYTIWAFLAECHRRGLIYRGHDVMPWCPRCGTGLSNMELATEGYRELTHLAVTVRLPITTPGHEDEDLLVWTTTPWTLSSNVAAAVHPDLTYLRVRGRDGRRWWLSRGSLPRVAPDAEVLGEAPGSELVGLTYAGPFDELPAVQAAGVEHRVIGWDEVSDEEGTGVVHIAPGCGQEDFALSKEHGLAVVDPIDEFGVFREGFGWQSGRYAGADDPSGADLAREVADDLERRGLLVARDQFTHSYPVCWRCGTQVVFRLVDEWFIAMDPLREPLAEATRQVRWLPEGIGLEERELDWLRNMSDWMISKKRYYGLALPIWQCTACEAWEVIGSRQELRERAVAGWEEFEGHSPHRPWVDAVEIACASCGARARRITDVGNPWLDAGIVGLSTLKWNSDREYWREWYPADWISESFPGQFRNWFYALLTECTVMTGRPPMKTLFGYALLRDEHGEEMHKSKGNAIWFDDAAEQIGSDVMRWMFCSTNPAVNMNFGYGLAHEEVRRFFLPLWNTYGFFVTYARLDGWTPKGAWTDGEADARTLLDRWILSRLDATVAEVRDSLDNYDAARATRAIESFVDELSNWYVRRNRRRFWKGALDADKRAAHATLYRVLVDLVRLLAPFVPHLADTMWENLVVSVDGEAPDSVHLTDFPSPRPEWRDAALEEAVALARRVVGAGRTARAASGVRTRQPLAAIRVKLPASAGGALSRDVAIADELREQILEELNVKALELLSDESEMVERTLFPLLPVIGPRHGAAVRQIMAGARSGDWRLRDDGTVEVGGVVLAPDEFQLTARARPGHEVAEEGDVLVALDTALTPELEAEGLAREVAHRLQNLRKAAGYEISDRIAVAVGGDAAAVEQLSGHRGWLAEEVLAVDLRLAPDAALDGADATEETDVDGRRVRLAVKRG